MKLELDFQNHLAARQILAAHASFPLRPHDAEDFLYLLAAEKRRLEENPQNYVRGQVLKSAIYSIEKRRTRGAMAGLVALSFLHLRSIGANTTLEKASLIASEVGYITEKLTETDGNGHYEAIGKLNADLASVKKIFREYRSVAHIWAANLCVPDDVQDWSVHDHECYFCSIMNFQKRLQSATDTSGWAMVEVVPSPPANLASVRHWDESTLSGPEPSRRISLHDLIETACDYSVLGIPRA
jgi:hypothetical protein